jgi:HAD superfamily hydrolase (TIGR01509 family)
MIKAIIFDFDGVIADTEPLHFKAFQSVLQEIHITFTEEEYWSKYLAMSDKDLVQAIIKHYSLPCTLDDIQKLLKKKEQRYMKLFQEEPIFFHGVKNVLTNLSKHFPLVIASGALLHEIIYALNNLEVTNIFKFVVSVEDVSEGKPNPQIFYLAYKKLLTIDSGLKTKECLVIEDSIHGILAAHNANMKCLAVAQTYKEDDLQTADAIINHISQLNCNLVTELFK